MVLAFISRHIRPFISVWKWLVSHFSCKTYCLRNCRTLRWLAIYIDLFCRVWLSSNENIRSQDFTILTWKIKRVWNEFTEKDALTLSLVVKSLHDGESWADTFLTCLLYVTLNTNLPSSEHFVVSCYLHIMSSVTIFIRIERLFLDASFCMSYSGLWI